MIQSFNNTTEKVGDDLKTTLLKGSKVSVAAALFSMYGFNSLKKELQKIESLRFIFTDPAFIKTDSGNKQNKLFSISNTLQKKSIGGSDFEINLKNELTGRSIARECKKWIEKKVRFKTGKGNSRIQPTISITNGDHKMLYIGVDEFSSAGFGFEKDNTLMRTIIKTDDYAMAKGMIDTFDEIWHDEKTLEDITDEVIGYISNLYKENSPEFIYYLTLYHIFNEFLEDITEDELANEKTGFKNSVVWNSLYDFQKDAVLGLINKLERYNGCILADSVGLGKTYTALGVIKYYQERNKSILVLCPKKLGNNWQTFLNNYDDNPLIKDRFNYTVLYHTDLNREKGESNGIDLSRINWGNYDLVVIDESHNFRNNNASNTSITRYQRLLNQVMRAGVKTKLLMLSATPVNNRFTDLKNQIALAYEGDSTVLDAKLGTASSVDTILKNAQQIFNEWSETPSGNRNAKDLLEKLNQNFDFFKLLDNVTIARSRKHIEKHYDIASIGTFPTRLKPKTIRSAITDLPGTADIKAIYSSLTRLNLAIYSPFEYILNSKKDFYSKLYDTKISETSRFSQESREKTLQKLMRINFLKRLESSVDSFRLTVNKYISKLETTIQKIVEFEQNGSTSSVETLILSTDDYSTDSDDWLDEEFSIGDKVKLNLADMNISGWKEDLQHDQLVANALLAELWTVTPEHDTKLQDLKAIISEKVTNPINGTNKKILIFSAFADTTHYLYENLADWGKRKHGLEFAKITGSDENAVTLPIDKKFNTLLTHFSPRSKKSIAKVPPEFEIDILIATDCIAEGQNLQDCDALVNYDIHWNPVRIIQRFGRIDRIGSTNKQIQLVNFWPQLSLDDYINLKSRVETRMFMVDATATGEDNVLTNESTDLIFRKKQLERLQNEVIDIEDMDTGISITDLGLNDFRMDLINYLKDHDPLDQYPNGMHTVCLQDAEKGVERGIIFVLKNRNNAVNIDSTNQLHPFYLVYILHDGSIHSNHLNVKQTLDMLRMIARGKTEPIAEAYQDFNDETKDGTEMKQYSQLLNASIESILNVKEETDIESLFTAGGTTALVNTIKGLEDFELISFIVIK